MAAGPFAAVAFRAEIWNACDMPIDQDLKSLSDALGEAIEGYKANLQALLEIKLPQLSPEEVAELTPKRRKAYESLIAGRKKLNEETRALLSELNER